MKTWLHLIVVIASAGLMAACGGGGSDSPTASGGETTLAEAANAEPSASEFMKLAKAAGTTQKLSEGSQLTLIAPSNEAMAEMRAEIDELMQPQNSEQLKSFVESHLVAKRMLASDMQTGTETAISGSAIEVNVSTSGAGTEITVNDSGIKVADVKAKNGVLFVTHKPVWRPSVFTYVKFLPTFSILEKAIREAGLVDALRADGPITLFAPTDAAFASLLAELNITAEQLLANKPLLTDVLTYHVLPQKLSARKITNGATPVTLEGQAITFDVQRRPGPDVRITDAQGRQANVIFTNLFARNGVVHVIDKVILPQTKNVVQIAQGISDFSILVEAVVAADLATTLSSAGPFTVFAPTNAAFAALLDELKVTKEALLANKALLTKVLTYHVVPGRVLAADIKEGAQPATVQGEKFTLSLMGGPNITDARGRKANIVATNVQASNGVIHVIDKVILPKADTPPPPPGPNIVQVAQSLPDFSILVEAVVAADLVGTLSGTGPFTVFAPNNNAFAALLDELKLTKEELLANKALLTAVLTYHVLPSKVLAADIKEGAQATTVQGQLFTLSLMGGANITDAQGRKANIIATDVAASNGVIHVIDKVILPQSKNIVQIALGLPNFSILVEAVLAADLQGTLSSAGPFTVFAPTNAAFAALLDELKVSKKALLDNKALLTKVLTYHVLPAKVLAKDVTDGQKVTTVQGQQFTLNKSSGGMLHILDARHRGANVVATDVQAVNGVIHVIDRVLLPKP
jgi:uncharacterized surface protein with fasciclin (FAS1) repeats